MGIEMVKKYTLNDAIYKVLSLRYQTKSIINFTLNNKTIHIDKSSCQMKNKKQPEQFEQVKQYDQNIEEEQPFVHDPSYKINQFYMKQMELIKAQQHYIPTQDILFEAILSKRNPVIREQIGDCLLQVYLSRYTKNHRFISIDIGYNKRMIEDVHVMINTSDCMFHYQCICSSGNYANVYKAMIDGQQIAVKCFKIKTNETLYSQFIRILRQYALLRIASLFKAAPAFKSINGFSIFKYLTCFQFTMESCQSVLNFKQEMVQDLKKSLVSMHRINFIHFDIKPQNICYSPQYKKYVFVDFGLSEIINEQLGKRKVLNFRGSLAYCSDQMIACSRFEQAEVDPYYNDLHCLKKSMQVLKQANLYNYDQSSLIDLGYLFVNLELYDYFLKVKQLDNNDKFGLYKQINKINSLKYCDNVLSILRECPLSEDIIFYFQTVKRRKIELGFKPVSKIEFSKQNTLNQQVHTIFTNIFQQQVNKINNYQIDAPLLAIKTRIQSTTLSKREKMQYIQQYLMLSSIEFEEQTQQNIFKCFYQSMLKRFVDIQSNIYNYYCYSHLLTSFLLFQVIEQSQFMKLLSNALQQLIKIKGNIEQQAYWIIIIFKFLIAIDWIKYSLKTIYSYQSLSKDIQHKIKQITPNFAQNYFNKLQYQSTCHRFFDLYLQIGQLSTYEQYNLFRDRVGKLTFDKRLGEEMKQIKQYLACQLASVVILSFHKINTTDQMVINFFLENVESHNQQVSHFYLNIPHCMYHLDSNLVSWVKRKYHQSFSQFSFYDQNLLYYYDFQQIFNFDQLLNQIQHNLKELQTHQKIVFLHRVIKFIMSMKLKSLMDKQNQLCKFIVSLKNETQIKQYFLAKLSQDFDHTPQKGHRRFLQQYFCYFQYFIAHLRTVKFIDIQYQIRSFLKLFKNIKVTKCLTCKAYTLMTYWLFISIQQLLSSKLQQSSNIIFGLFQFCRTQATFKQFFKQSIGIYYYMIKSRDIKLNIDVVSYVLNLVRYNEQLLAYIIYSYPQLYHQIFKQSIILYPESTVKYLIVPTVFLLRTNNTYFLGERLIMLFSKSWVKIQQQLNPPIFTQIFQSHFYELAQTIHTYFTFKIYSHDWIVIYIIAFMRVFKFQKQNHLRIYKFISLAMDNQRKGHRPILLYHLYQVMYRKNKSVRYNNYRLKLQWKLATNSVDINEVPFLRNIKAKKCNSYERIFMKRMYNKAIKFTISGIEK